MPTATSIPFQHLGSFTRTTMSFFEVTKYPPSLQYVCVDARHPACTVRARRLRARARWIPRAWASSKSTVAFHSSTTCRTSTSFTWPRCFTLMIATRSVHVHPGRSRCFNPAPPQATFSLPIVYLIWIAVVAVLYLPCRWFANRQGAPTRLVAELPVNERPAPEAQASLIYENSTRAARRA